MEKYQNLNIDFCYNILGETFNQGIREFKELRRFIKKGKYAKAGENSKTDVGRRYLNAWKFVFSDDPDTEQTMRWWINNYGLPINIHVLRMFAKSKEDVFTKFYSIYKKDNNDK